MPRRVSTTPLPNPPDSQPIIERLRGELKRLSERLTRIEAHQMNANREVSRDWQDRANELQNDEVVEALLPMTRREIDRIKQAITRLETGETIACEVCGRAIPEGRLAIVPETRHCAACAA
jgi:DnaK suppressor protein